MLTVRQPWAWAIAAGYKTIENRTWTTSHCGELGIHAGIRWDDDREDAVRFVRDTARALGHTLPHTMKDAWPLTSSGYVLAVVDLVGICDVSLHRPDISCGCGPWAIPGQAHWRLESPRVLDKPLAAKGQLQLWELDFTLEGQQFTAAEIIDTIHHALQNKEIHAIEGLLKLLAVRDPAAAQDVMDTLHLGIVLGRLNDTAKGITS
ncbi:hypothetical protein BBK82_03560 [Lentzea guizhouensis]|uniref:ASCH domain-containing protein n=2 Tax=Lentzea guizhouensis TaxID=1586287 RepID=A0A1B2HC56_9PSEU|nr:hypothetical protein BBK82_03560 [Lentzea guizhouensis]